jgi:hypothetical protein
MVTPETWTTKVERATMLYYESNFDTYLLMGLQQIQESPGFKECMTQYINQDPCGRARWEHLKLVMTEIENRRIKVQPGTTAIIRWEDWFAGTHSSQTQTPPPLEEVLHWIHRMERAAELYQLSDYDRMMTEFHQLSESNLLFYTQMMLYKTQDPMGGAR